MVVLTYILYEEVHTICFREYSAANNGKIVEKKRKYGSHCDNPHAVFDQVLSEQISMLHIALVTDIDFGHHGTALRVEFFPPFQLAQNC